MERPRAPARRIRQFLHAQLAGVLGVHAPQGPVAKCLNLSQL
ncbi:MAG: hypothetical protein P4L56_06865 [Candidatus Sulfopaludibacter sp.]|nr:hypothetical protein [Candidatus Sulfopaludibacter sp.]